MRPKPQIWARRTRRVPTIAMAAIAPPVGLSLVAVPTAGTRAHDRLDATPADREISCHAAPSAGCLFDLAVGTAILIPDAGLRAQALRQVVDAQIHSGRLDMAGATALRIEPGTYRIWALRAVAVAHADAGELSVAHTTADAI
jgi:hypothetical protein